MLDHITVAHAEYLLPRLPLTRKYADVPKMPRQKSRWLTTFVVQGLGSTMCLLLPLSAMTIEIAPTVATMMPNACVAWILDLPIATESPAVMIGKNACHADPVTGLASLRPTNQVIWFVKKDRPPSSIMGASARSGRGACLVRHNAPNKRHTLMSSLESSNTTGLEPCTPNLPTIAPPPNSA